jgi:hypothetical protein
MGVPLLLLLMLGAADLGRLFFDYVEMRNAAGEGATYAARNPLDVSGARQRVRWHGVPDDVTIDVSCVNGSCTTPDGSGRYRVTVSRTFEPITTGFLEMFGLGAFNLSASATARAMT